MNTYYRCGTCITEYHKRDKNIYANIEVRTKEVIFELLCPYCDTNLEDVKEVDVLNPAVINDYHRSVF